MVEFSMFFLFFDPNGRAFGIGAKRPKTVTPIDSDCPGYNEKIHATQIGEVLFVNPYELVELSFKISSGLISPFSRSNYLTTRETLILMENKRNSP